MLIAFWRNLGDVVLTVDVVDYASCVYLELLLDLAVELHLDKLEYEFIDLFDGEGWRYDSSFLDLDEGEE